MITCCLQIRPADATVSGLDDIGLFPGLGLQLAPYHLILIKTRPNLRSVIWCCHIDRRYRLQTKLKETRNDVLRQRSSLLDLLLPYYDEAFNLLPGTSNVNAIII